MPPGFPAFLCVIGYIVLSAVACALVGIRRDRKKALDTKGNLR